MGDDEFRHICQLFLSRLIGRVVLILLDGMDSLLVRATTPKIRRVVIVVVATHTTRLLYHLSVTEVAHLEHLRHHHAAVDGSGTLGNGIEEILHALKLCHRLVVIHIGRTPCRGYRSV